MVSNNDVDKFMLALRIPEGFKSKASDDSEVLAWNRTARQVLKDLRSIPDVTQASPKQLASIVASLAALDGEESWIEKETRRRTKDILSAFQTNPQTAKLVLENHVKPLFFSSPHPHLNTSTGRTLPRSAGGDMAAQDYYDEQTWKAHPGAVNIVSWCILQIPTEIYEQVWHLLIPPVMTFLDDYQAPYKLRGVKLVSELLQKVPPDLLKRTGVGQLLMTSLARALQQLHDKETPQLIRETVPVALKLTDMVTLPGSAERFDQLCHLLGEGIIGGVWVYASRERETVEASLDVLPAIVSALEIGTARYLKALIPQCLHAITPSDLAHTPVSLQLSALKALISITRECQPRIYRWKGAVIEGVGKCWVVQNNNKIKSKEREDLTSLVIEFFALLSEACPTVLDDEYPQLLRTEPNAFKSIISIS